MDYLPIALDVRRRVCVVVGGGQVALRKIEWLASAGASIRVIAKQACLQVQALAERDALTLLLRAFVESDLDDAELVIAATDDREINARVSSSAAARGLLVNVVDDPALCSFIVPALVDRSPVVLAISTQGASPVLARLIRRRVEALLHPRIGELARFAAEHRDSVRAAIPDPTARRTLWERVLDGPIADSVLDGDGEAAAKALRVQLSSQAPVARSTLVLVALPDELDAVTLGAMRVLGNADLVAHDASTLAAVQHFVRRDARLLPFAASDAASLQSALQELGSQREHAGRACLACSARAAVSVEQALRDAQIAFTSSPLVG